MIMPVYDEMEPFPFSLLAADDDTDATDYAFCQQSFAKVGKRIAQAVVTIDQDCLSPNKYRQDFLITRYDRVIFSRQQAFTMRKDSILECAVLQINTCMKS